MNELDKRAFSGLAWFLIALAALLFIPAWTLYYREAWTFLAVFGVMVFFITLYLMKNDRALLARRVDAGPAGEKEKSQKLIQTIASVAFVALFVVSALDHRFSWSHVSDWTVATGDILVVVGLLIVFFVFKENSFTSATIETAPEQKVISTGPYAIVRHPMYAGAFVMLLGIPLSLGSWYGLIPVALLMLAIIWRLIDEERYLHVNLQGYTEYTSRVRSRIIPLVW